MRWMLRLKHLIPTKPLRRYPARRIATNQWTRSNPTVPTTVQASAPSFTKHALTPSRIRVMDGGAPDHLSFKQHRPGPRPIRSIPMLVGVGIEVELHPRACTHHLSVTLVVKISSRRSPHRRFQAGAVDFDEDLTRGDACCGIDAALGILCEGPGERHGAFATGGILDLVTTSVSRFSRASTLSIFSMGSDMETSGGETFAKGLICKGINNGREQRDY